MTALSASLILSGCNKKKSDQPSDSQGGGETQEVDSYKVSEEEYKAEMIDYGFFIHQNVTYSGPASMGVLSSELVVNIADNVIYSGFQGERIGMTNFFRLDYSKTNDEGEIYADTLINEPGGDETTAQFKSGMFYLSDIITESSYILVVSYGDLEFNEENNTYNLKAPVDIEVAHEEDMRITKLSYKFVDGKLDHYYAKFGAAAQPEFVLEVEFTASKRGETVVEFPVVKNVKRDAFNEWITDLDKYQFGANITFEATVNEGGQQYTVVDKFDDNKIEETIYDSFGKPLTQEFYEFDQSTLNEETGMIDYNVYQYSNSSEKWYTMPYGGNYLSILEYRTLLLTFDFSEFEFDKEDGRYNLKEATEFTKNVSEFVCQEYHISFLYYQLQNFSFISYEKGHEGDEEYIFSVSSEIKDIGTTVVELPELA